MRRRATLLLLGAAAALALPAEAGKEKALPRPRRSFDHDAHASVLRARTGGTEGCAGKCHRADLEGGWVQQKKQEHARCFEGCHRFTGSCGELARGAGRVCITCHTNLRARCLPAGARPPTGQAVMPARYSHKAHMQPGASGRQCEACHGPFGDGPRGRGAVSIGHADCGGCHGRQAAPRMTQCQSCHQAGGARPAARPPDPYSVGGAFSHERHASERRVGPAGRACLTCHDNIAVAADDRELPMPTMRGCLDRCHDGVKAFSAVGSSCTRCHKGSGKDAPAAGQARFSHEQHRARGVDLARCAGCHAPGADFQVAPPTRGKDHRPCAAAGCHVDEFLSRGRPLCSVCHDGSAPWVRQPARARRAARSEFGSDFSHRTHLARRAGGDPPCAACHAEGGGGGADGHRACAPCHGRSAQPGMDRCGGCHAMGAGAGRSRAPGPWSVAARFRHDTHARDPRRPGTETRCLECHAGVAAAARLDAIARPTMKSCAGCHDGRHAFKTTGFDCARCHGPAGRAEKP
jgi:c(7)-type cytochrome triheme protein